MTYWLVRKDTHEFEAWTEERYWAMMRKCEYYGATPSWVLVKRIHTAEMERIDYSLKKNTLPQMKPNLYLTIFNALNLFFVQAALSQAPKITSFAPTSGPSGTAVTITGTNFSATAENNIVYFGAVEALSGVSASANELVVYVPRGASYQPITVTVNGLTASSSAPFNVTFPGNKVIDETSFAAKVDFATNEHPADLAVGDFNRDGRVDLIVCGVDANAFSILRNTESSADITSGSFDSKVDFATSSQPRSPAVADLDGDGKLDVVLITNGVSVTVFKNTSSSGAIDAGSFTSSFTYTIDGGNVALTDVAVGDLDGDGKPDLAVMDQWTQNRVLVFKNVGSMGVINSGSFAANVDFPTGAGPGEVAIADLNGDGKPELIVANNGGVNAEGKTVSVFKNTTVARTIDAGSFAAKVDYNAGRYPSGLAVGDLDGDHKPDIAVANYGSASVSVLRNQVADGIINADSFAPKVDFATGTGPNGIAMGDLDGDGKADLAVTNANFVEGGDLTRTISLLHNTSSVGAITAGSFAPKVDFSVGINPMSVVIADFDGDDQQDLALTNSNSNTISVLRNKNPQTISEFTSIPVKNMGDPSFTLSASATSGLPVQFTSKSDRVSIAGNTVTIVKPGSATIIAEQPGNNTYSAAPKMTQTFCVNPAKPTLTLDITNLAKPMLTSSSEVGNVWYLNGEPIADATGNEFVVKEKGIYTVKVVIDDCVGPMSEAQSLIITADETSDVAAKALLIPNPARDFLAVRLHGFTPSAEVHLVLLDATGRAVSNHRANGGEELTIDVRNFPEGLYLVTMLQGKIKQTAKFIKK